MAAAVNVDDKLDKAGQAGAKRIHLPGKLYPTMTL